MQCTVQLMLVHLYRKRFVEVLFKLKMNALTMTRSVAYVGLYGAPPLHRVLSRSLHSGGGGGVTRSYKKKRQEQAAAVAYHRTC